MELYFLSVKRGDFTPKIKMLVCNGHEINDFFFLSVFYALLTRTSTLFLPQEKPF